MPEIDDSYHQRYKDFILDGKPYTTIKEHPIPPKFQLFHDKLLKRAYYLNYDVSKPLNEMQMITAMRILPYKICSYYRAHWNDSASIICDLYNIPSQQMEKCILLLRVGRRDGKSFLMCRDIAAELLSRPVESGSYKIGLVSKDRRIANENARNILAALSVMDWDQSLKGGKGDWKTIEMIKQNSDVFELRPKVSKLRHVTFECNIFPGGEVST